MIQLKVVKLWNIALTEGKWAFLFFSSLQLIWALLSLLIQMFISSKKQAHRHMQNNF